MPDPLTSTRTSTRLVGGILVHWSRVAWWLAPLTVLWACTLPHIGDGDWMRGDSAWYAAISLQAWRTGGFWTLMESPGHPYFNKPPLSFWIQGGWMSLLGAGAWQARTATVLAASLGVVAAGWIARTLGGRQIAIAAGTLLAVNIEYFRRTREISLDMWNTAFMLIGACLLIMSMAASRTTPRRPRSLTLAALSGLVIGCALLTKPLIALGVPVIVLLWAISTSGAPISANARVTSRPTALILAVCSMCTAIVVAAPWHVSMIHLHGDLFISQYFGREIADRAAGELVGGQKQTQPAWFYLINLASAWTMWAAAAGIALALAVRFGGLGFLRTIPRPRALLVFATFWTAAWLCALSFFPDRRDRYAMPVHAGCALLLASLILPRRVHTSRALKHAGLIAAVGGLVFAIIPVRVQRGVHPQWPAFFAWLSSQQVQPRSPLATQKPAWAVWDGAFSGAPAARFYLEMGFWPTPTRDAHGVHTLPSRGEPTFILYHRRGGWLPGPGEEVAFQQDDLIVTRFTGKQWRPTEAPDPGE